MPDVYCSIFQMNLLAFYATPFLYVSYSQVGLFAVLKHSPCLCNITAIVHMLFVPQEMS